MSLTNASCNLPTVRFVSLFPDCIPVTHVIPLCLLRQRHSIISIPQLSRPILLLKSYRGSVVSVHQLSKFTPFSKSGCGSVRVDDSPSYISPLPCSSDFFLLPSVLP